MPSFTVVYRTPDSPAVARGVFPGQSETLVRQELVRRGWSVLLVQEAKPTFLEKIRTASNGALKLPRFGVSTSELALLCEIFKALYSSGVQMLQIVEMTIDETPNPWLRKKLVLVLEHLRVGDSLADAMSDPRCRRAFPPLMVETIRTGEANGRLDDALDRLKRTFKRMADIRRETISAMIYPSITLLVFFGVCYGLAIKIPQALDEFVGSKNIASFRQQSDFPFAIEILLRLREHPAYLIFPPVILVCLIVACNIMMRYKVTRFALTKLQRKIPLIGNLLMQFALVRVLEVFVANHESGIAMGDSLGLVRNSADDAIFEESLDRVRITVMSSGCGLSDALQYPAEKNVFPGLVRQMFAAGEASGRFSEMLMPIISYYEERSRALLKGIEDAMTPAMIVMLGAVIGPLVMGVYKVIAIAQMQMLN